MAKLVSRRTSPTTPASSSSCWTSAASAAASSSSAIAAVELSDNEVCATGIPSHLSVPRLPKWWNWHDEYDNTPSSQWSSVVDRGLELQGQAVERNADD
jgi:hypothetical protein